MFLTLVPLFACFCDPISIGDRYKLEVKERHSNIVIESQEYPRLLNESKAEILSSLEKDVITKPIAKTNREGCTVVVWQSSDKYNTYIEMTSYHPSRGWSSSEIISDSDEEIAKGVYSLDLDENGLGCIYWNDICPEPSIQLTQERRYSFYVK
jgi:hypothetical protein